MRLATINLAGFRRFEDPVSIDLAEDLVALVGPNEAGKSSVLDALETLLGEEAVAGGNRTRHSSAGLQMSADFLLTDADRERLFDEIGAPAVRSIRWWRLSKHPNGRFSWRLFPRPKTDRSHRTEIQRALERFSMMEDLRPYFGTEHYQNAPEQLRDAVDVLESPDEDLSAGQVRKVQAIAKTLLSISAIDEAEIHAANEGPSALSMLRDFLVDLSSFEEADSVATQAGRLLIDWRPRALMFSQRQRDLRSTYNLDEIEDPATEPALLNLLRAAGTDFYQLRQWSDGSNRELRATLLDRAGEKLTTLLDESWTQEQLRVRLDIDAGVLKILVGPRGIFDYADLEARSDGLRWFLALRCFIEQEADDRDVILLIDEAETHLHYDAQVDLIDVLTKQKLVQKVVYTTHSAACLPRDLGNGVRVIQSCGNERSMVRPSIWSGSIDRQRPGPIAIGHAMGAYAFAFLPARFVFMVEGPSDAMLIPALFREVLRVDRLRFQVIPGLSEARAEEIARLSSEAGKMAFLVDGDTGGEAIAKRLVENGIAEGAVFRFSDYFSAGSALELEDLVDKATYIAAVNTIVADFASDKPRLDRRNIQGAVHRSKSLSRWAKKHGLSIDKPIVAQRLLDRLAAEQKESTEGFSLIEDHLRPDLQRLLSNLQGYFEGESA